MIMLIIKSYLTILLAVGAGSLLMLVLGLYFIFRKRNSRQSVVQTAVLSKQTVDVPSSAPHDWQAIAGDDVIATQLDLARAYIETGKKQLAEQILKTVLAQAEGYQQQEAQQLLSSL